MTAAPNREKQQTERVSERVAQRKQRKATKQRGWHRGNREKQPNREGGTEETEREMEANTGETETRKRETQKVQMCGNTDRTHRNARQKESG